jgi:DNA-binding GntR family transcriptional regulator
MLRIPRPQSLTEIAVEQLRRAIVAGDLALGEQLSEAELARRLGISKTPVREALQQLRIEGLVRVVPQSGTFVFTLSAGEVHELCEVRLALEQTALGLALERDRAGLAAALDAIVRGMREARERGDTRHYLELDTRYHEAFFMHAHNGLLAEIHGRLIGRIAALRTHLAHKPDHTRRSMEEHEAMLAAIMAGEDATLRDLLDRHIGRTRATYAANIADIAAADRRPGGGPELPARSRRRGGATG